MKRWIALLLLAASLAGAQVRSIPDDARVGQIHHLQDMVVEIDGAAQQLAPGAQIDRKSTRLNSSHLVISYAVFCLKKKKKDLTGRMDHRRVATIQIDAVLIDDTACA